MATINPSTTKGIRRKLRVKKTKKMTKTKKTKTKTKTKKTNTRKTKRVRHALNLTALKLPHCKNEFCV